jgi:hypothetical protein
VRSYSTGAGAARPRPTLEEATSFERRSAANARLIESALTCGCRPYVDVFTVPRWNAQGFKVRKGQKTAVRVPVVIEDENGRPRYTRQTCLFCRCQVEPST